MPKLPLIAGWAAWMICAGISVVYARNHTVALSEYRYEVLYTFGTWATCYTLARRHGGARWLGRVVVLRLLISEKGAVDNVAVVRAEPRGIFEQAAIEAFSKARFAPGLAAGTPVKSQITVEVQFMPINRGARVSGRTY